MPPASPCEPDFSDNQSPELESGVNEFLPKPFAFDELVKRMEKLVRDSLTERLSAQPKTGLKTTPVATPQPTAPIMAATNPPMPSRGTLDPPSNLFRVLSAEEGLAKLTEATRIKSQKTPESKTAEPALTVATAPLTLPDEDTIMTVFGELLDRNLSCMPGVALKPTRQTPVMVASFATVAEEKVMGVCFIDLALANSAAGALALLSEEEVQSQLEKGDLPEHLFALLKDVFRVLADVFNQPDTPEIHLHHLYRATGLLPHEDAELIENHTQQLDLKLDIEGYQGGLFSLML